MFSAKNYGLPKDLIEAAKKVHEKQLEEQQKPTSLGQAVERVGLAVQGVIPKKATKPSAKDVYKAMGGTVPKLAKKPQAEEVQFTEEELAEAFAIFLEENFHVEMLTEEDLDYVFENEFPQWLEEQSPGAGNKILDAAREKFLAKNPKTPEAAAAQQRAKEAELKKIARETERGASAERQRLDPRAEEDPMYDGSGLSKAVDRIAAKITSAPKPTPRNQVSAKPAASARKSAPKIDYKTPVTRRGPDGTYGLTSKGRRYVARKEAQERKKPFSASKFFSQMQRDGN